MTPTPHGGTTPDVGRERLDAILGLVAHPHRRILLSRLREDDELRVGEVAAAIAAWEDREAEPTAADARAVEAGLHHVHIPKLTDANVVEYDAEAGAIARGRRAAEALRLLPGRDGTALAGS